MSCHITTKIENLEISQKLSTYLLINISKSIEELGIELYSDDSKIIINSTIDDNSLILNPISMLEIDPCKKYFLKINYRLNGEIDMQTHHEFIIMNSMDNNIEMIIHKKKHLPVLEEEEEIDENEFDFNNITGNQFFMGFADDESDGVDPEDVYETSDEEQELVHANKPQEPQSTCTSFLKENEEFL